MISILDCGSSASFRHLCISRDVRISYYAYHLSSGIFVPDPIGMIKQLEHILTHAQKIFCSLQVASNELKQSDSSGTDMSDTHGTLTAQRKSTDNCNQPIRHGGCAIRNGRQHRSYKIKYYKLCMSLIHEKFGTLCE